jgi:hypothetical protein
MLKIIFYKILNNFSQLQQFEMSTELSRYKPLEKLNNLIELLPLTITGSLLLSHLSILSPNKLFSLWSKNFEKKWENINLCNLNEKQQTNFIRTFLEINSKAILGYPGIVGIFPKWLKKYFFYLKIILSLI